MSDQVAIEVKGLTRYSGDLLAVSHVSFEVQRGEIFGFPGPNVAGKTTTIRILTTRLEPTEGTAHINGYDIARRSYRAKHIEKGKPVWLINPRLWLTEALSSSSRIILWHAGPYRVPLTR